MVRGSSTHALRLILCTCDECTCRAAAECILRLQSGLGHRQCFSCASPHCWREARKGDCSPDVRMPTYAK